MKKLIIILSFTLGLATVANAETWSCAYIFYGEPENDIFVREGDRFKGNRYYDIVHEDDTMITLHYSGRGYGKYPPVYFAVLLDKTQNMFAEIGLVIGNSTQVTEGKCKVY